MTNKQALMIAVSIAFTGIVAATAQQTIPSSLPGCVFIAAGITLTNLQSTTLMCDINGHLKVNTTAGPP